MFGRKMNTGDAFDLNIPAHHFPAVQVHDELMKPRTRMSRLRESPLALKTAATSTRWLQIEA